ncbi:MAG: hypothetical protein GY906_35935 [bacterium]|nr:hypothetical protein [bacterium]
MSTRTPITIVLPLIFVLALTPKSAFADEPIIEGVLGWTSRPELTYERIEHTSLPESTKAMKAFGDCDVFVLMCTSADFTPTFIKLKDLGTFMVHQPGSTVIAKVHGRFGISTLASGTGALFELRLDDAGPSLGYARPSVRQTEIGLSPAVPDSATGVFTNIAAGNHQLSIWVRGAGGGSGTGAMIDPGCWSTDNVVVEQFVNTEFQVFNVSYTQIASFTTAPTKIADIGTFPVSPNSSVVELTYNGRFKVSDFDPSSTGAIFELRVDDQTTNLGHAASHILEVEASIFGTALGITGIFPNLSAGVHTASVWVTGAYAGGSHAAVNPDGWFDQLLVTEHRDVSATVIDVPWNPGVDFTEDEIKLGDIGSFEVLRNDSTVELIYHGRIGVSSMTGTGVVFELKVDDLSTTYNWAKTAVKFDERGIPDIPANITTIFTGLTPGTHTVSMWAAGMHGGGTRAGFNWGNWLTDHLVVLEHGTGEIFRDGFESGSVSAWSTTAP